MPLPQLRNHAIALSFGRSTLGAVSAAPMDARIIFGLQSSALRRTAIRGPGMANNGPPAAPGCTSSADSSID